MKYGLTAAFVAVAIAAASQASAGGRTAGWHGMGGPRGFHGFYTGYPFNERDFLVASPYAPFGSAWRGGWSGGAYSAGVAGFDDYGDSASEDLHFRVQEPFGPGDIGNPPPPPPEAYGEGPWEGARLDPWHGYEPTEW